MNIVYKCHCMKEETTITVPDRRPLCPDILKWMEMVTFCIGTDHRALSPRCNRNEMEYAKIPYDEASPGIGVPASKN